MPLIKIAVLDDYQGAALQMADWSILDGQVELTVFQDHVSEPDMPFRLANIGNGAGDANH